MNTVERIKNQSINHEKEDRNKPCFGIVVPPSPFTVPPGWEFVLRQPFEGVSYIATVLNNAGYRVKIIDVRYAKDPINETLIEISNGIDILGIATYEDNFPFIKNVIEHIKAENPKLLIILGGSLVTSVPIVVMKNTEADIAVLGEGEITVLELADSITANKLKDIKDIAGICYKDKSNNIFFTKKREQLKSLDFLPTVNFSLWPNVRKNSKIKEILFSHSRGCYMNCSFCYRTTPQLSQKSIDKFRKEIKELKNKHNFEFIYFVDLTFAIQKERTIAICSVLKDLNVKWSCMSRVQNIDRELLEHMQQAGCEIILYGFESVSQDILNNIHKGITVEEIRSIIYLTQEAGIKVGGLFIVGLPGENEESLNALISFSKEIGGAVRVKYLSAIPGTEIYKIGLEKGLIKSELSHLYWLSKERGIYEDDLINFTSLSDEDLRGTYRVIDDQYIKGPRIYGF